MSEVHDDDDDARPSGPQTFGQKHGLTIMMVVMAALLAFVCTVQVGC